MAKSRKTAADRAPESVVVGATNAEAQKTAPSGGDFVTLSVSLRGGHVFDDIPDGRGGLKKVRLAGLDDRLRGEKSGILAPAGNAVFQRMPRADWDAVKALHGAERMFNRWNGLPPCVFEVESAEAAMKGAARDEIAAVRTGADPIDPAEEPQLEEAARG